jgi:uncharacterized protein (TIGR02266 family)
MSTAALRWIRTLKHTSSSWRARRESEATSTSETRQSRVSLIPDSAVVWPAPRDEEPRDDEPRDDEPRFLDEERPTRVSRDARVQPSAARERRTSDRAPFLADLEFGEDAHLFTGLSLDISAGGLFVATYTDIPLGTRLLLCFELPDGTAVEARGEVKWRRSAVAGGERPGIGIAFTELGDEARQRIAALCAEQPPLYFEL